MKAASSTKRAQPAARRYRSPLRDRQAAETRSAVIGAAGRLFVVNGWAGTGMRDVAAAAGVAIETVYAHFSSKRGLLQAVVDVAVVGDDRPVALAGRPEFAALGQGRRADRARAAARLVRGIYERTAPFAKVLREAAASDQEIAQMRRETQGRQRLDVVTALKLVVGRAPTAVERDGCWAITSPEVYLLLVEDSGWTPAQYEEWMAEVLERVVPRT